MKKIEIIQALKKEKDKREAKKCLDSFYFFVKCFFDLVPGITQPYQDSVFINLLCDYLQNSIDQGSKHVINVPPATGKSTIISVLFPCWLWARDPKLKICSISYTPNLSNDFAKRSLDLILTKKYQSYFTNVRFKNPKILAKSDYQNTEGGSRFATSTRSILIGKHFDLILIDDPNKANDSKNEHQSTVDWLKNSLPTRFLNKEKGILILIQQRLAKYDCSAYALEAGWNSLILPMRYVPDRADPRDWRTTPGELLIPERITEKAVTALELELGIYGRAQLQQSPTDDATAIFKPKYFEDRWDHSKFSELIKKSDKTIITLDLAQYAKDTSDYSAMCFGFKINNQYYIYKDFLFKKEFPEQVQLIKDVYNQYNTIKNLKIYAENRANGTSLVSMLKKENIPITEYRVGTRSKIERANAISYLFSLGSVHFSDIISAQAIEQLTTFPVGKYDDFVDCISMILELLSDADPKRGIWDILQDKKA